jgi:chromosome segregation ATPase
MKNTEQHIEDLHFEHKLWQSEANFYRDELKIYQKQVEGVGQRAVPTDAKDRVSYFENQFKDKNNELQSLTQEIAEHEHCLADIEKDSANNSKSGDSNEHLEMRKKFVDFKDKYAKLKDEFKKFLEDWI